MVEVRTCLWFNKDAEDAVRFYTSIVPGSGIENIQRAVSQWPGGEPGEVIVITFHLADQKYMALNGGSKADYGFAASISVQCENQSQVDALWEQLKSDGGEEIQCGWVRDRWGIPWQVVPEVLPRLLSNPDPAVVGRVFEAMVNMVKLDSAALEAAAAG